MAKANFGQAPRPPVLSPEQAAFIDAGRGKDRSKAPPTSDGGETHRLSLDIPKQLAKRFKAACALADTKMTTEILAFIRERTIELERFTTKD